MLLLNCRCLYIFLYKPTICFIVSVAYEQKEIEKIRQKAELLEQQLKMKEQTDTYIGMILYYYTIYTTFFSKNK